MWTNFVELSREFDWSVFAKAAVHLFGWLKLRQGVIFKELLNVAFQGLDYIERKNTVENGLEVQLVDKVFVCFRAGLLLIHNLIRGGGACWG